MENNENGKLDDILNNSKCGDIIVNKNSDKAEKVYDFFH